MIDMWLPATAALKKHDWFLLAGKRRPLTDHWPAVVHLGIESALAPERFRQIRWRV
jgi:hypothetical protein